MATETEKKNPGSNSPANRWHNGWLVGLAAIIVLLIVFVVGLAAGRVGRAGYWTHGYRMGGYMMGDSHRFLNNGFLGSADQTRVIGTVTAVNGSSFTVAGGGSTNTVTTDSSTQWEGGNSVKTNDTVVAYGSINNGTFTATLVQINP